MLGGAAEPAAAGGAAASKPTDVQRAAAARRKRKLGDKPSGARAAKDLPKKSGYLLKKGPLKVGLQTFVISRGPRAGGVASAADTALAPGRCGRSDGLCWRRASSRTFGRIIRCEPTQAQKLCNVHAQLLIPAGAAQYMKVLDAKKKGKKLKKRFRRGLNMDNEAEVIEDKKKKGKSAKSVQHTGIDEEDSEFDNDIDFTVTLGSRKLKLRSGSREEKLAWTKAMETASVVRSYSSKNLNDDASQQKAIAEMKDLSLEDLDIGEIIGSGSAGTVKLAVYIPWGLRVAVKIIPKRKFFMNKKLEETTTRELEMLDKIKNFEHPHIVQTYGYVNDSANVYIALELCEGGELLEELENIGNYTEHDAATIVHHCVETLGYLHEKGIVHRDIKPENLLLLKKGDADSIKLADFGLANILEGKESLQTVCGSPAYMAPEVHNMLDYDAKVDMWSMGVMLYLLLSGTLPFLPPRLVEKAEAQNYEFAGKLWKNVSDAAKDLVVHLLVANPEKRYGVKEVLAHPWITGENREDIDLNATKKAIALFSAKRKFKGMAHAVIASSRMKKAMAGFVGAGVSKTTAGLTAVASVGTDLVYTAMDGADKVAETELAKSGMAMAKQGTDFAQQGMDKGLASAKSASGYTLATAKATTAAATDAARRATELEALDKARSLAEKGLEKGRDGVKFVPGGIEATNFLEKSQKWVTEEARAIGDEVRKDIKILEKDLSKLEHAAVDGIHHLEHAAVHEMHHLQHDVHKLEHHMMSPRNERRFKMQCVVVWLERGRLGIYADKFEQEGYDDIEALREMEAEEIEEMVEEVQMKRGHARHFRKRMAELQSFDEIDKYGNNLDETLKLEEIAFKRKFVPYEHLPMPVGSDSDLSFQLGVGIGTIKVEKPEDSESTDGEAGEEPPKPEIVPEVHDVKHRRFKSPPRKGASSPSPTKRKKKKKKKKKKKSGSRSPSAGASPRTPGSTASSPMSPSSPRSPMSPTTPRGDRSPKGATTPKTPQPQPEPEPEPEPADGAKKTTI